MNKNNRDHYLAMVKGAIDVTQGEHPAKLVERAIEILGLTLETIDKLTEGSKDCKYNDDQYCEQHNCGYIDFDDESVYSSLCADGYAKKLMASFSSDLNKPGGIYMTRDGAFLLYRHFVDSGSYFPLSDLEENKAMVSEEGLIIPDDANYMVFMENGFFAS